MASSDIPALDALLAGTGGPVRAGSDRDAVGGVQDLLAAHDLPGMPGLAHPARGVFGPRTRSAVATFCQRNGLPVRQEVDGDTLRQLIEVFPTRPLASQAYLTLGLDRPYTANLKVASVVARLAGGGLFAETRLNPDRAGLSFGLLPAAQRHGGLHRVLEALNAARRDALSVYFGGFTRLDGVLAHTGKASDGLNDDGTTDDPNFDLISPPWVKSFRLTGLVRPLQAIQADWLKQVVGEMYTNVIVPDLPALTSERGVAFAFDLVMQFEAAGAKALYDAAATGTTDEGVILARLRDASVAQLAAAFPTLPQVATRARDRRNFLLATTLLGDAPFVPDGSAPSPVPPPFPERQAARFFLRPRPSQKLHEPKDGVNATAFVGGRDTLFAMLQAIGNANAAGDFIYMLNWHFDSTFELSPGDPASRLQTVLAAAAGHGVQIRAMVWAGPSILPATPAFLVTSLLVDNPLILLAGLVIDSAIGSLAPETDLNRATCDFLNELADQGHDVRAILDHERGVFGSHHQKVLVVSAGGTLTAFVGGVEYNTDRIDPTPGAGPGGAPLFDTAVRLEARAAWLALRTFADRWTIHPEAATAPHPLLGASTAEPAPGGGPLIVQVTHTYGRGYSPRADRGPVWSASDAITNGILNARQFFYIEDQYFVGSRKLRTAIRQAFRRKAGLYGIVLLAAEACVTDLDRPLLSGQPTPPPNNIIGYRRRNFLNGLRDEYPGRFLVFERLGIDPLTGQPSPTGVGAYVHSKLVIVDDEAAFVGSVNSNRRSWYRDSEVDATIVDATGPGGVSSSRGWVRDFRCRVWREHFGVACNGDPAKDLETWGRIALNDPPSPLTQARAYDVPAAPMPPAQPSDMTWVNVYDLF